MLEMLNGIFTSHGYTPDSNDEERLGRLDLRVKDRYKKAILIVYGIAFYAKIARVKCMK